MLRVRRVPWTETEWTLVDITPMGRMVWETYDGIIGDAPSRAIPFRRFFDVGASLRGHASKAGVEGMMSSSNETPVICEESGLARQEEAVCGSGQVQTTGSSPISTVAVADHRLRRVWREQYHAPIR